MSSTSTPPDQQPRRPAPEPLLAHSAKRWVRRAPYAVAFVFTVILVPVTANLLANEYGTDGSLATALGLAQVAPLLLAVRRPLLAWCVMFAADVLGALEILNDAHDLASPWPPPVVIGYLVMCLALSLRASRRALLVVWTATVAASLVLRSLGTAGSNDTSVLLIVLSGVVLLLGALLRERGDAKRRLVEQETISEAERAQRTLLEERARIARELHDVVAHHMSVITVQAESAPYRLTGVSDEARAEFEGIAASARESLGEMRRLLAVLRSEDSGGERAPQPGLDRLQHLVEAAVRAGVPVDLSRPDPARLAGLPEAVDLSAYRIVQEALSNVMRHAPGARTQVKVAVDADRLLVLVVNGPSDGPPAALESSGTGHGLVGMRERVRLVGGTVDVGPLPDGGFRVAARLPLPDKDSGTS